MLDIKRVKGVIVPLVTPLDPDENVDTPALARIVNHLIENGVDGVFALGTTGEFARLDDSQKAPILETCVAAANGRVPVYAGVSACGSKQVIRNIRQAKALGADIAVCTLPYYFPVRDAAEQTLFFNQVSESSDLPLFIYNIPATIASSIDVQVVEELARAGRIMGIKDSSGDLAYISKLLQIKNQVDLIVTAGSEDICIQALRMGAEGIVPSMANVFPKLFTALYAACLAGDIPRAERYQAKVDELNRFNTCTNSWLAQLTFRKKALSLMGFCDQWQTEPYLKLDDAIANQIAAAVEAMKTWA